MVASKSRHTDGRTSHPPPTIINFQDKDELSVWVGGAEAAHRPPTGPGVGETAAARSSRHPPLTTTGMFQTRTQKTRGNRYIMFTRNMKLSLYTTAYRLTEESQE